MHIYIYIYISFSYLYKYSVQTNTCEFRKAVNLPYGQGGLKLEINIPPQHILAKSKGGLIIEGGVSSNEYGTRYLVTNLQLIFLLYNMSTQRLAAVTTSISPIVKPRGNQFSSIHLRVLRLVLWLLNLGQKVRASNGVVPNVDISG